MGVVSSIRVFLPEVGALTASFAQLTPQKEGELRVTATLHGPVGLWKQANAKLLAATAEEITKAAGPQYVESALRYVYPMSYYIFTAVVFSANANQFWKDVRAYRNIIAELPGVYHRYVHGDFGSGLWSIVPQRERLAPSTAAAGPMLKAWDDMIRIITTQ